MLALTDAHLTLLMNWINQLFWPFLRVGGLLLAAPVLGDNRVPARIKIGLCIALTVVIAPATPDLPVVAALSAQWLLM
ncbi:MAG: flagellar biosynthetic protein FliR, partial [Pseudomonadota bacterium]